MTDTVRAPAKLTLSLRVSGVRDDGYHLIDAEMIELELADILELTATDGPTTIRAVGPHARGVPTGPDNLIARALELTGRSAEVVLHKHIPAGGGLGGGSADAAAVLRWAGWTDAATTARLGADVPFCLVGGRARVTGIGERLEALERRPLTVMLVAPPLHVSTPDVYRAWDALGGPRADGPNDLEPAALVVEPRLARYRDVISDVVGEAPVLAGSGGTWFVAGDRGAARATEVAAALADAHVVVTRAAE